MQKLLITSNIMRRGKQIKDGTVLEVGKDISADEAENYISMECAEEYSEVSEETPVPDDGTLEASGQPDDEGAAIVIWTAEYKEALLKSISDAESHEAIDEILSGLEEPEHEIVLEIQDAIKARMAELDVPAEKTLDEVLSEMTLKQLRKDLTDRGIPFHTNAKEPNLRKKLKAALEATT